MTKEELEKELKDKDSQLNNWYKEWQKQEKRIAELEKENAELKERYAKNITDCDICDTYCNSQLTKAKEIIKTILGFMQTFGYSPSMDKFVTEAEQFLSEVEK